jgi:hypothetical protein
MTVPPPPPPQQPPYGGQYPPPPQQPPYGGQYPPPYQQYPQPQQPPPKSSGCGKIALIGCIVIIVLGVIAGVVIALGVFTVIKKTDVYKQARDRACNDPRVIAALGEPVTPGFIVTGGVHIDTNGGNANVHFPIKGSRAGGKVDAEATYDGSKWTYSKLLVTPDNGPPIDLTASQ